MTLYVHRVLIDHVVAARPWVAKIVGIDRRFGIARDFVAPLLDHREAQRCMNGKTCGVVATFPLDDGIYEFSEPDRKYPRRYFARVVGGALGNRMSLEEVQAWAVSISQSVRSGRPYSRRRKSASRGSSTRSRSFT